MQKREQFRANRLHSRLLSHLKRCFALVLCLSMVLTMSACKPTDLFTEVVITPFSDVVDWNNPEKGHINNIDASLESATMTALDWTDSSPRSLNEENLVSWSDNPTSDFTAHHSIFSLTPRFAGIRASDPVRFTFSSNALFDHTADANNADLSALQAASKSLGGSSTTSNAAAKASEQATTGESTGAGETADNTAGGTEAGNTPDGNANSNAAGTGSGASDSQGGQTDRPLGGYNGDVDVYNPGDGFARVNQVNHLAVIGTDVAVMAQSLGGAGTIVAMNEYAYYGLDGAGQRTSTFASFADVFAGETPGLEHSGLLWSGTGAQPATVRDMTALAEACGDGGVIVFDQAIGLSTSLFDLDQRRLLQAYGIQLVPVDMRTVQGMLDASQVMGEALRHSSETAQDAYAMGRQYRNAVGDLVRAVAGTHGDAMAYGYDAATSTQGAYKTIYNTPPVSRYFQSSVFGFLSTDSETGINYLSAASYGNGMDASQILLFGDSGSIRANPVSFWFQTAGVLDQSTVDYSWRTDAPSRTQLFWPFLMEPQYEEFSGGSPNGALQRWLAGRSAIVGVAHYTNMFGSIYYAGSGRVSDFGGLGSERVPYLIVAGSDGKTAAQIKAQVVNSMLTSSDTMITPYSALKYFSTSSVPGFAPPAHDTSWGSWWKSTIGNMGVTAYEGHARLSESPFYLGLKVDEVIRENPVGLLGSWTEGNMESVLEAVWLASIYSKSPANHPYVPIVDMSNFAVSIGGTRVTTARDAILQFYKTFYRVDASGVYNNIVTDEGIPY